MDSDAGAVVDGLRARQGEIERAVFVRVREAVPEPEGDAEYLEGLRVAVAAAVEFGIGGLERGAVPAREIPAQAVAQAQLAARSGVNLEAVLRRYIVGHALLWDFVMEEADRVQRAGGVTGLRGMSQAQAALLDQLVMGVTREHVAELQRAGRSREHRLLERVRLLLAGGEADGDADGEDEADALELESGYELAGAHLAVIGQGPSVRQLLGELATALERELLSVPVGDGTVWAWFGGKDALYCADLQRALAARPLGPGVLIAAGEPGRGLEGWRGSHRQARAAHAVVSRSAVRRRGLTPYGEVALLANALRDEVLARDLAQVYLAPLDDERGGGAVLRQTLRAYIAAECNVSSTAAALGVARNTIDKRLRTSEARLGRTLHPCPPELAVALGLEDVATPARDG